ncbi:MAG TPA: prolyl oligopeptidase family serine peptidase, partial [Bacteroidales bacterium]|nr:prolyl oligopeptidase family serine peptidase [Bacteroidales bacterium]
PETPFVFLNYYIKLIDSLNKNLNIGPKRIYITGISMGGFGTWDAISRWPKKFAAAVPVCGGADTSKADIIKDIPIWAFHGEKDQVVLTSRSRNMIQALKKAGGNPKYTEYPELGHNIWGNVYTNQELFIWLFSQTLTNRKK